MKQKLLFTTVFFIGFLFSSCEKDKFDGKACFTYSPTSNIQTGEMVTFSNCSENSAYYIWSFGDGNISTEKEPTHIYSEAGTYTLTLAVQNQEFIDVNGDMIIDEKDRYSDSDLVTETITVTD